MFFAQSKRLISGKIKSNSIQLRCISHSDLQVTALELEQELSILEESTNSSVVQLELRVATLEETDVNQETRLTTAEAAVEGRFKIRLFSIKI